jgi:hypothetical protein
MKSLYIQKISTNHYEFDFGNDSTSGNYVLSMRKTAMGWNIEVTDLTEWETKTTFLWVADTAREAVNDCLHSLRYFERHYQHSLRCYLHKVRA